MPALAARLGLAPFDPRCLYVTSPWFSPAVLAFLRLLLAVWTTTTIIVELVRGANDGSDKAFFSYFTHLSYIGITAYFWAAGVQTLAYALRSSKANVHFYPLQRWGKTLQFLHILLGATVLVFPIIVTAVFWALLAGPSTLRDTAHAWENISVHALNTALAGFEMLLTNTPPPPALYVFAVFLCLAGYLGVAYVTFATQGFYTYAFLDPKKEKAKLAAYIVGIGAAGFIVFGLASLVIFARQRLVRALISSGTLRDRTAPVSEKEVEGTQMQNVQGSASGSRVSVVGLTPANAAATEGGRGGSVEKGSFDV